MARSRAIDKRRLADQQAHTLRPFADVKSLIDRVVSENDRQKATITEEIARQKAERTAAKTHPSQASQAPAAAISSALPPPQWVADPTGRHQYRYWNGQQWTEHISDGGDLGIDPLM